ncbi:MAG: hypothetical protein KAI59_06225 [Planctomycetes bacterium]|nr:hypothetical protein [Planctomycetota bacterium]MCK5473612.1 hypothetical protein [Planctomycetota bacterium]
MKKINVVLFIFLLCIVAGGCQTPPKEPKPLIASGNGARNTAHSDYMPVKVGIIPLTEFAAANIESSERTKINIYVSLYDGFGCEIKSPGVFRFELYEYVQLSAESKGRRIVIWPDVDLNDAVRNNQHWRDFLRAYEFNFDFEPQNQQEYVLQATYINVEGRRILDEFLLK